MKLIKYDYEVLEWHQRALNFARSLKCMGYTEAEQRVLDKHPNDRWAYFMAFGIMPEKVLYNAYTIRMLEGCIPYTKHSRMTMIQACIRLEWTAEELSKLENDKENDKEASYD